MRASALAHHMGHFYHSLVRTVEVGLFRFKDSPRIFDRLEPKRVRAKVSRDNVGRPSAAKPEYSPLPTGRRESHETKKLIISVHIPKTGGTAFGQVLKTIAEEILYRDYHSDSKPATVRWRGKCIGTGIESAPDPESLPGRSVIHGHFPVSKYASAFPNAVFVTWLRDPVDRVASHHAYWQRTPYPDNPQWTKVITENMELEQFAQLDFARDLQYRSLRPLGVEGFAFIGITEEYERSLQLFHRLICPDVRAFQVALRDYSLKQPTSFYDLDRNLRERILKLNERDAYTYVDGLRRFRRLCEQVGL